MIRYRRIILSLFTVIIIIFLGSLIDLTEDDSFHKQIQYARYAVYYLMILAWAAVVTSRIYLPQMRVCHILLITCLLNMVFVLSLRLTLFDGIYPYEHYAWYAHYIFSLAAPLISYQMTLYVGRPQGWKLPKPFLWVYLPYLLLVIGILTNESHMLAFWFDERFVPLANAGNYHISYLYLVSQAWYLTFTVLALRRLYVVCRRNDLPIRIVWPAFYVVMGILYTILYALDRTPDHGIALIDPTAMSVIVTMGLWESCFDSGLFPSNRFYDECFSRSMLPIEIMDSEGRVRYLSEIARSVDRMDPDDYRSRSFLIPGGSVRFREEIKTMRQVIKQLDDAVNEKEMIISDLRQEARVLRQTIRAREKISLFDRILTELQPKIDKMDELADKIPYLPQEEKREALARIGVFGAYVKRRSNLSLISMNQELLSAEELYFCLRESLEAIACLNVETSFSDENSAGGSYSPGLLIRLYEQFEEEAERMLPVLKQLDVKLLSEDDALILLVTETCHGMDSRSMRFTA